MSKHRNAVNPPRPIPETPPPCEEAKRIARQSKDEAFQEFQDELQTKIDEATPTWKQIVKGLFKKGK